MTFDKYGQTSTGLIDSLRLEEADLMSRVNRLMCLGTKEAAEHQELSQLENRLQQVRGRITEEDTRAR
jgi:hypothetical protein